MSNVIRLVTTPKGDKPTADYLRSFADKMESGEVEGLVMAAMVSNEYEIMKFASHCDSLVLSTLLQDNALQDFKHF